MCNPRRVNVTATEQIRDAWERTVRRAVELIESITGEARVTQPLNSSVGAPALVALESLLVGGQPGWTAVENGYRFDVDGGYLIYNTEDRGLEIVAARQDVVRVTGEAQARLEGVVEGDMTAKGEGRFYDDNYGGRTEADARRDAEADARRKLEEARQQQVRQARETAEAGVSGAVEAEARRDAERLLAEQAAARRAELERQAAAHLETVGLRCRREFNRVLALAYRDAILAYARSNGAENVQCSENDEFVDIEFMVER